MGDLDFVICNSFLIPKKNEKGIITFLFRTLINKCSLKSMNEHLNNYKPFNVILCS